MVIEYSYTQKGPIHKCKSLSNLDPTKDYYMIACSDNQITSLEFCPSSLQELYCYNNQITSLKFCPSSIEFLWYKNNNIIDKEIIKSKKHLSLQEYTSEYIKNNNIDYYDVHYILIDILNSLKQCHRCKRYRYYLQNIRLYGEYNIPIRTCC